jgi:hypothetical protein
MILLIRKTLVKSRKSLSQTLSAKLLDPHTVSSFFEARAQKHLDALPGDLRAQYAGT